MRQPVPYPLPPTALEEDQWSLLLPYGTPRRLGRGQALYRQGDVADGCWYLRQGRVKAVILGAGGTEKILEVMGPGALLGEAAAFDGKPHYSTCIALGPVEAFYFTVDVLVERMQADERVARLLLRALARKQRVLAGQVEDMAFCSVRGRVARLLQRLFQEHGTPTDRGLACPLRITHAQIASIVGGSRVAVTRALNQFRREGIITGNPDGGWILRDPHLLAAAAADDPTW